jgi:hypothetical protein
MPCSFGLNRLQRVQLAKRRRDRCTPVLIAVLIIRYSIDVDENDDKTMIPTRDCLDFFGIYHRNPTHDPTEVWIIW